MQGLILAAGMGKRLKSLTAHNTKCMVKVNGVTMIERALTQLDRLGLSRIVVVVGYEAGRLKDYISTLDVATPIEFVDNPVYDRTNNIYSLMVQTYDGENNILKSRLETSNKYEQIFNKTAQGYPGASNNVFVQLGMYWQLHLAYDGAKGEDHGPMWFFNQFFKDWKAGTYYKEFPNASYDEKVALTAAGVTGKITRTEYDYSYYEINMEVPSGTDLTRLAPDFTLYASNEKVYIDNVEQTSGNVVDFTNPVKYRFVVTSTDNPEISVESTCKVTISCK